MNKIMFVNLYDFTYLKKLQTPLGILSLYVHLKNQGEWNAEICDFNEIYYNGELVDVDFEHNIEDMAKYIIARTPDIISIYTMCDNYHIALFLCKKLKELAPNIKVVMAGPHATMVAKSTLEEFEYIDFIGLGEGEDTVLPILNGIINNNFDNLKGFGYRDKNGNAVIQWDRFESTNIDKLDFIDLGEIGNFVGAIKEVDIEGGRGCPFHCAFCSTQLFWGNNFRVKSLEKILEEVEFYIRKYNTRVFSFQHDLFTFNKKYIMSFCDELIKRKLNIKWKCSSRVDVLDEEMIEKIAASGCLGIFFGVETGSKIIQKKVNKNLNLDKIDHIVEAMIKNNMGAIYSFIYGFPTETETDLNDTLLLIYHIKNIESKYKNRVNNFIELWPIAFLPGTKLGEEYKEQLQFNELRGMDFNNSIYSRSTEVIDLIKNHKNIFLSYYNLEKNISTEFQCLNTFIMILFNYVYMYINNAIDSLIEYFDQDILRMFYEIFSFCEEEIKQLSVQSILEDGKTQNEELCRFVDVIKNYMDKSGLRKVNIRLYDVMKMDIDQFYLQFKEICIDSLIKQYPQLLLEVKAGMSASMEYQNIVKHGHVIEGRQIPYITSKKDCLFTSEVLGENVELAILHNRSDFERVVQIMAYKCEPHPISESIGAVTLRGIVCWNRIREYQKKYIKSGKKDWEEELQRFTKDKCNYTNTLILINGDINNQSCLLEKSSFNAEWIENYSLIIAGREFSKFASRKQQLSFTNPIQEDMLFDCLGMLFAMQRYDKVLGIKLMMERVNSDNWKKNGKVAEQAMVEKYGELFEQYVNSNILVGNSFSLNELQSILWKIDLGGK